MFHNLGTIMKKSRKQCSCFAVLTLTAASLVISGCSSSASDPAAKAPEDTSSKSAATTGTDTKTDAADPAKAEPAAPDKKSETAAKTETPTKETEANPDTTSKKRMQDTLKAVDAVPRTPNVKPRTPAPEVKPQGDVSALVGTYNIDLPQKNDKINQDLAKKGRPTFLGWIKIAANGTYQYMFGTTKGGKVIAGSIVVDSADPTKLTLHPQTVNGKPATAEGDKLVFNMRVTPDKKSLLMTFNLPGGEKKFPVKFTKS